MKYITLLFFTFLSFPIFAQSNISGVINDYAVVTEIEACTGAITVNTTTGFSADDRVMLIQMQGATMVEADNQAFGTVIDLGSCGAYEINTISSITGNIISLSFSLINNYDLDGKVQLVRIPIYESATVVGEITAQAWDGEKGGIIALEVENTLTINADINANGAGFRGGTVSVVNSDCQAIFSQNDYFYEAGNWRGAPKGEGLTPLISGKEWGRGAQTTGGGGGNDHNAGGGGGSNVFAGGQGGERSPDGIFDCDGEFPGEGGVAFAANSSLAFLGGGGGAGHTDNVGVGSNGGNGGGIIYIKTNTLQAGGGSITANGQSFDTTGDGAGGGGAGGTVILDSPNNSGNVPVQTQGGRGGNTNANSGACSGPGGGGSGGRVLTNSPASISISLAEGQAGVNNNPNELCNGASNGATSGQSGTVEIIIAAPQSNQPIAPLAIIDQAQELIVACTDNPFSISINAEGFGLNYQWQADFGSGFEDLNPSGAYNGETTASLTINNPMANMSGWLFRVIITSNCGEEVISNNTEIQVTDSPTAGFTFENIAPFTYQFTDTSFGSFSISWDFDDMAGSAEANPVHVFSGPGTYVVTQIISSPCGTDIFQQTINLTQVPTATFSSDVTSGCSTLSVNFVNESQGMPTQLEWQFPGGLPNSIINDPEPTIMYPNAGIFDVILIASNGTGADTITQTAYINVDAEPVALFSFDTTNDLVEFTNESFAGSTYLWDFGDDTSSSLENPTHTYAESGFYDVTLTVTNPCGSSSITLQIAAGSVPQANFDASQNSGCATYEVQFFDTSAGNPTTWDWQFPGGTPTTSNEQNPVVTYDVAGSYVVSLSVTNAAGNSFLVQENYILVEEFPEPEFIAEADPNNAFTFNFTNQTATQVNQYIWNFGDGNTSSELSPTHTYDDAGTYLVTLNALNNSCGAGNSQLISILPSGIETDLLPLVEIFPNPFTDNIFIEFSEMPDQIVQLRLLTLDGKIMERQSIDNLQNTTIGTSNLPAGVYILQFLYENEVYGIRLMKQ